MCDIYPNSYLRLNIVHYFLCSNIATKNKLVAASCPFSTPSQMRSVFPAFTKASSQNADPGDEDHAHGPHFERAAPSNPAEEELKGTDLISETAPRPAGKKLFHQKQMSEQQIVKHLHDTYGSSATPHTLVHVRFILYSISGGWYYVYFKHEKADLTEALK